MGVTTASVDQATRWWWVRHAPVTENRGHIYGQSDLSCDTSDQTAFVALARMLPENATWVVSNLRRTQQTAAAIIEAGLVGLQPMVIPEFAEQHFGTWQGKSYASLADRTPEEYHRFWLAPAYHRPPEGESFDDLIRRVRPAIHQLNQQRAGGDIIAVAHGGTIRAAVAEALSLSSSAALSLEIGNLSVTRLDFFPKCATSGDDAWRVNFLNRLPE